MSRRKKKLPAEPQRAAVESLTHDGRGVARIADKTVFIDGALPQEEVMFRYTRVRSNYDEGAVLVCQTVFGVPAEDVPPLPQHLLHRAEQLQREHRIRPDKT